MGLLEDSAVFNEENAPLLDAIRDSVNGERRVEMCSNPFFGWLQATAVALLGRAVEEGEARETLDVECVAGRCSRRSTWSCTSIPAQGAWNGAGAHRSRDPGPSPRRAAPELSYGLKKSRAGLVGGG